MENKIGILQLRHPDYDRELTELVRSNLSPKAFREKLLDYHENDIAAALETLTPTERQRIYHALDAAELSAVLEYAEPMTPYLNELSLRRRVDVLSRMDADAAVDYLKTLESAEKTTLVELMDEPKRREIARLWVYGEDEIGSIMTTNCIVPPKDSYKDRLYTTGAAGYPGCPHIPGGIGETKDFSRIIEQAKTCPPPAELETGEIVGGFAHAQVFALADRIVEAVKSGAIRKFVVMGGCEPRVLHRVRPGPAPRYRHPDGRLRQVQVQQAGAGRHRRHSPGAGRRPVQ